MGPSDILGSPHAGKPSLCVVYETAPCSWETPRRQCQVSRPVCQLSLRQQPRAMGLTGLMVVLPLHLDTPAAMDCPGVSVQAIRRWYTMGLSLPRHWLVRSRISAGASCARRRVGRVPMPLVFGGLMDASRPVFFHNSLRSSPPQTGIFHSPHSVQDPSLLSTCLSNLLL